MHWLPCRHGRWTAGFAFVVSGDPDLPAALLSEHIVFRSPLLQSPIPGRAATPPVLTTVVRIFRGFRYHHTFAGGFHDVALEFDANIGKWQLRGIDRINSTRPAKSSNSRS
jgi:hypothetical protein